MMQIILYDDWLTKANEKVYDTETKKNRPRMSKMQIKQLLQLCVTAEKTKFLSNGILYHIK